MTNTVLLNDEEHAELKVLPAFGAEFGDAANQITVFPTEFVDAQRELPILFRKDAEGKWQALALTGLDKGENLFLDGSRWTTRFVPAVQRRGPFKIGFQATLEGAREPAIHVDLDDPRVGNPNGVSVFLPQGGNSPYLDHVLEALRVIHDGIALVDPVFDAFESADLLEPVTLEVNLSETTSYKLQGFSTISTERLASLSSDLLHSLNTKGFLGLAFAAVSSLSNVNRVIELKNRKLAEG